MDADAALPVLWLADAVQADAFKGQFEFRLSQLRL
jgi:hypothetical protein